MERSVAMLSWLTGGRSGAVLGALARASAIMVVAIFVLRPTVAQVTQSLPGTAKSPVREVVKKAVKKAVKERPTAKTGSAIDRLVVDEPLAATFNPVPSFKRIRTYFDRVGSGLEPLL